MRLPETFLTNELPEAQQDFAPIPNGMYTAAIEKCEVKETKSGTGQYLNLMFKITGPDYAGRVIFSMINFRNQSQKAEEIGRQQLGSLLRAVGLPKLQDTDQLIGTACQVKVTTESREGYDPRNVIKAYKAIEGSEVPKPTEQSATSNPFLRR